MHVEAFDWFGGVFERIRFDNLTSAVKQVLKGRRRVETDRFVALRSHYLFESQFTTPGIEGAHEKGGVEGEVGRFRRNHLVPVPVLASLAELNALLLAGCEADLRRRIIGRQMTVGEAWASERPLLRALPGEPFDATETAAPRVDAKSLVTIRQNRYSASSPRGGAGAGVVITAGLRSVGLLAPRLAGDAGRRPAHGRTEPLAGRLARHLGQRAAATARPPAQAACSVCSALASEPSLRASSIRRAMSSIVCAYSRIASSAPSSPQPAMYRYEDLACGAAVASGVVRSVGRLGCWGFTGVR